MRLAAYLCTSRHGIFYFRWPLPIDRHPARKRGHVKVSLGTREPGDARYLARLLAVARQSALARPSVRAMRYDENRHPKFASEFNLRKRYPNAGLRAYRFTVEGEET